jgi:hypothetical protein
MGRPRFPTAIRGARGESGEKEGVTETPASEAELVSLIKRADEDADQT